MADVSGLRRTKREIGRSKARFCCVQSWPLKCAQPIKPKITPKKEEFAPSVYDKNMRQTLALPYN